MADYFYPGTTKQNGSAHQNKLVALKIDPLGTPMFTVLAETTADVTGAFRFDWGDSYGSEPWAGRIAVVAADDDGTVKLDCIAHDWLSGTLVTLGFGSGILAPGNSDLEAMYTMGNVSGATIYDETANAEDLTAVLATQVMGKFGLAYDFTAAGDYLRMPPTLLPVLPCSFAFWATVDDLAASYYYLQTRDFADESANYYGCYINSKTDGSILTGYTDGGTAGPTSRKTKASPTGIISATTWHHIVTVIRGSGDMDIYVDGVDVGGSYSGTGSTLNNGGPNNGKLGGVSSNDFKGQIDKFRVFDRSLTQAEVLELYGEPPQLLLGDENLIAHYTMDRIVTTSLKDETDNANHGTITGALPATGKFGLALEFDGGTDRVDLPTEDIITGAGARTISLWFNRATLVVSLDEVLYMSGSQSVNDMFGLTLEPTDLVLAFWGLSLTHTVDYSGAWHHVVATYDGTDAFLYYDGVQVDTLTIALTTGATYHRLGGRTINFFEGLMDQFRLYDRVLSAEEVAVLFTEEQPIVSKGHHDLVVFYSMDNISGSTLVDDSIAEDDGTITGAVAVTGGGVDGGDSLLFDGSNDYATITGWLPNDNMSLSFWLKMPASPTGDDTILMRGESGESVATNFHIFEILNSGNFQIRTETGGGTDHTYNLGVGPAAFDGVWRHYVYTLDAGDASVYENGVVLVAPTAIIVSDTTCPIGWLGRAISGGYLGGELDLVRCFNRVLTTREIAQLFAEGQ